MLREADCLLCMYSFKMNTMNPPSLRLIIIYKIINLYAMN